MMNIDRRARGVDQGCAIGARVRVLARRLIDDKRIRFLFVGVLNTAVGYGSFAFFLYIGFHYFLAQLASTIIGGVHSYLWNKRFTFRSRERSLQELFRFLSVYAMSYASNMVFLYVFVDVLHMSAYVAGAVGLVITTVVSYIGHNKVSFRSVGPQKS